MTVAEALALARGILAASGRGGWVEAERLLETVLAPDSGADRPAAAAPFRRTISRAELYSRMGEEFPAGSRIEEMARLVAGGRPLQYVTGTQTFLDHEYEVSPAVLIPRPETEVLAVSAIEALRVGPAPRVGIEIGIGSGVLSIELLAAFPELRMIASELTVEAAGCARRNAKSLLGSGADRLEVRIASRADDVLQPFGDIAGADFLISNPPYLEPGEATAEVSREEPGAALWAPLGNALHFYSEISAGAPKLLRPGSAILLEVPHERANQVAGLFVESFESNTLIKDLTGRNRVLIARTLAH